MSRSFRARLFNQHQLSDTDVLERVWRHLDSPLVKPVKFDVVEEAGRDFRPDAVEEAAELFDEELHLFVVGAEDDFLAVFTRPRRNLSIWTFWLDAGAMQGEKGERWLEWLSELCAELPPLYGVGCTLDEYEAKHSTSRALEGGGSAEVAMDDVVDHRERRAGHVVRPVVDEDVSVFRLPLGLAERHFAAGVSRLPHAEEPHPVEPVGGDPVELGVGQVVQRGRPPDPLAMVGQSRTSVDLQEGRIPRVIHGQLAIFAVPR